MQRGIAVLGGLLVLSLLVAPGCPAETPPDPEVEHALAELYGALLETGFVKKVEPPSTAYVDPAMWRAVDVDKKRKATMAISKHLKDLGGSGRVYVVDYQSGKRLATWTILSGFEVE